MSVKYHDRNSWDEDLGCIIVTLAIIITIAVVATTTIYLGSLYYTTKENNNTMSSFKDKPNYQDLSSKGATIEAFHDDQNLYLVVHNAFGPPNYEGKRKPMVAATSGFQDIMTKNNNGALIKTGVKVQLYVSTKKPKLAENDR